MNIKTHRTTRGIIAVCALTLSSCSNTNLVQDQGTAAVNSDTSSLNGPMIEPSSQVKINLSPGTIPVSNWESLGGCSNNIPTGTWTDEANFMVAVKGCDNKLWIKRWNNDVWTKWTSYNTCLKSTPHVTVNPQSKQLALSYVDCTGTIKLKSSRDAGNTWQDWASRFTWDGNQAVSSVWQNNNLVVYAVTNTGRINAYNANNLAFGSPTAISSTSTTTTRQYFLFFSYPVTKTVTIYACAQGAIAATADLNGRIDVVYPSCNNTPAVATQTNGTWNLYTPDLVATGHVDAVWNTAFPATLELFFQGPTNKLYQSSLVNGQWTAASPDEDPTPLTDGIATTNLNVAGEMTMLHNGDDGQIYMKFLIHTNPSSGGIQ